MEKQLTAQERAEAERVRMAEEKKARMEEERRRRLEGPQALIPGIVSNPDERSVFVFLCCVCWKRLGLATKLRLWNRG